jgi:geranylgeranyl transferase type-1 subunit beta
MRFLFCAFAISFILNDWTSISMASALGYMKKSRNYDGGFGVGPGQESHGGSTYCVVTSLSLSGQLSEIEGRDNLLYWLFSRQREGFHGRLNKPDDTCYGFWIGSCLDILDAYKYVDTDTISEFMDTTISKYGGYGKNPGSHPDVMHSYMGIAALSIARKHGLPSFFTPLGVSRRAVDFGKSLGFCKEK